MPKQRLITHVIIVVLVAAALVPALWGVDSAFIFNTLSDNRMDLIAWAANHRALMAGGFVVIYIVSTAFSVPGGAILTMSAGFLFGTVLGAVLSVIGATVGAIAVFLFAKTALGRPLRARAGPVFRRLEAGFRAHALSYLIVLRLLPIFPFVLVNLVPALVGMPLATYAIGTFLGIIPGALIYVSLGVGLDAMFHQCAAAKAANPGTVCEPPPIGDVFLTPEVILPLAGLSLLALAPVFVRRFWRRGPLAAPPAGDDRA